MSKPSRIIEGLKDAIAGNFARVTIEGQAWVPETHVRKLTHDITMLAIDCEHVAMMENDKGNKRAWASVAKRLRAMLKAVTPPAKDAK